MNESYKDILGYEGLYQVSNFGNVKSYPKTVFNGKGYYVLDGRIMKLGVDSNGYSNVTLRRDKVGKTFHIHKLVAIMFLDHKPNGRDTHVNHINHDRANNNTSNLEIITARENLNRKHLSSTSKYTGVCWHKSSKRWHSKIVIKDNHFSLGYFKSEIRASIAYEFALLQINKMKNIINY